MLWTTALQKAKADIKKASEVRVVHKKHKRQITETFYFLNHSTHFSQQYCKRMTRTSLYS